MKRYKAGGGWPAVFYTWRKAREAGGILKLWRAMRTKNACKTCALGMGGQRGGMVNELGHFPEVCKKSLQAMVADMQGAIRSAFWHFSGRSSNESGFLLQLFARLYGTNNVNNCSFYCHQASGVGLASVTGSGTATIELEDLEHADCVFVIGGNPASNHPRLMRTLLHVRRRGGEVIAVNPIVETGLVRFNVPSDVRSLLFGSRIATHYVQPHIGGDLAMLTGIAKRI